MKTKKVTAKDLENLLDLKNAVEGHAMMNVLHRQGIAKEIGVRKPKPNAQGKRVGKPAAEYLVPQEVTIQLFPDEVASATDEVANETDDVKEAVSNNRDKTQEA